MYGPSVVHVHGSSVCLWTGWVGSRARCARMLKDSNHHRRPMAVPGVDYIDHVDRARLEVFPSSKRSHDVAKLCTRPLASPRGALFITTGNQSTHPFQRGLVS